MRIEYEGSSVLIHAETMAEVVQLVEVRDSAKADRNAATLVIERPEEGLEAVWLEIPLRQRMPADKRDKGHKGNGKADAPPETAPAGEQTANTEAQNG